MSEKEYVVEISFKAVVDTENLEDLKSYVNHHLDYIIDESYFKSYFDAKLKLLKVVEKKEREE